MEREEITIGSFVDLAYYNGLLNECKRLCKYIEKNKNNDYLVEYPGWLSNYDYNHFIRVLWSILVIEYGDYGTSPRFGWLLCEKVDLFLPEFKMYIERRLGEEL